IILRLFLPRPRPQPRETSILYRHRPPRFESAAEFFTRTGFIVDREATTDVSKLSAWPRLLASLTPELQEKLMHTPKIHASWRLRVATN
ncbi:MAG TPA: hypothetical protein VGM89_15075, partial [Puia sp.]